MKLIGQVITYSQHRPTGYIVIGTVTLPFEAKGYVCLSVTLPKLWLFSYTLKFAIQLL